jgi:hypothetical protein
MSVELSADLFLLLFVAASRDILLLLGHMNLIFLELLSLLFQFLPVNVVHMLSVNDKVLLVAHFEEG